MQNQYQVSVYHGYARMSRKSVFSKRCQSPHAGARTYKSIKAFLLKYSYLLSHPYSQVTQSLWCICCCYLALFHPFLYPYGHYTPTITFSLRSKTPFTAVAIPAPTVTAATAIIAGAATPQVKTDTPTAIAVTPTASQLLPLNRFP